MQRTLHAFVFRFGWSASGAASQPYRFTGITLDKIVQFLAARSSENVSRFAFRRFTLNGKQAM